MRSARVALPEDCKIYASFFQRWQAVNDWLLRHEALWRPVPFKEPKPGWSQRYPDLATWLEQLSDAECDEWDEQLSAFAQEVARFVPAMSVYGELVALPTLSGHDRGSQAALKEVQAVDMPGRKRLQAGAFAASISPLNGSVLDWCCGKGHLARTMLGQGAQAVIGFEWDAALVQDGNRLAKKYGEPVHVLQQDVMADTLQWPAVDHGAALHACGDLHRQLLRLGSAAELARLSVSPCCYHLGGRGAYGLLSRQTRDSVNALSMDRAGLRLAVQETVTAPARERAQSARVRVWRLGFDALQRSVSADRRYLPVPSHPSYLNSAGFEAFCQWAADNKRVALPPGTDWSYWLAVGQQRSRQVRRHELLRHLFRRPLELWLVFDYAVYLEEQGYQVNLGTFCERSLTPRNLLLDAVHANA
ncbi:methyltransferase [Marinobacter sp. S0848L]|uniref:methyltransferase n=1 Tax=Marinobacter sp. S0848L TaxID=2926423 RepID=UPI001FF1AB33|nr:methyltransferase [Marinobacter sp. S0848L]MCK0105809.1 SAM-dependent methyltransferase [Marinobacter sp. S0848L]